MKRMRMRTDGLLTLVLVTSMLWVSCMRAEDMAFPRAPKFPEDVVILSDGTAIFPQRAKPVNGVGRPDFGEGP